VNAKEETYKVTVHLIDGTKLKVSTPITGPELMEVYRGLGAKQSRLKFPTHKGTMQFLPASSVLRIEAKGTFE